MPTRSARAARRVIVMACAGWPWWGWPRCAFAQPTPSRRLGVLLYGPAEAWEFLRRDLRPALAQRGWIEGRNLSVDWRVVDRVEQLEPEAKAMVARGAQALLTRGTPATRALRDATATIPIVTGVGDPVASGFAASLAAPGGNVTGLSYALSEAAAKRVELLREMVPRIGAILFVIPAALAGSSHYAELVDATRRAAGRLGVPQQVVGIGSPADLPAAIEAARRLPRPAALIANISAVAPADMAGAWLQAKVPTSFEDRVFVEVGGLMSYRFDWDDQTASTAAQLDQVLRGTPASQMPFQFPTKSQFVVNVATARALGIVLKPALRLRADEVIG